MKSNAVICTARDGLYAQVTEYVSKLAEVNKTKVKGLKKAKTPEIVEVISGLLSDFENGFKAQVVEGISLPAYLAKISYDDVDKITEFTLSIRSKLKAEVKYKKDWTIAVGDNMIQDMGEAYITSLYEMFYNELAVENVTALNERLAEICAAENIPHNFSFAVVDDDAVVVSITDDMVVFNVSLNQAMCISELGIFQSGDEYRDLICSEAVAKLVASVKACQTTVQLIKGNVDIIKLVTGVSTKKRASKLIRGSYHRKAENLDKVKAGVGYYEADVKIDGADVKVFALVEKAEDGTLSVVLKPFDVATNFTVDYDVLAALK